MCKVKVVRDPGAAAGVECDVPRTAHGHAVSLEAQRVGNGCKLGYDHHDGSKFEADVGLINGSVQPLLQSLRVVLPK